MRVRTCRSGLLMSVAYVGHSLRTHRILCCCAESFWRKQVNNDNNSNAAAISFTRAARLQSARAPWFRKHRCAPAHCR